MKTDAYLKLQAYLDGELAGTEARAVEESLVGDAALRDLLGELTATRNVLKGNESEVRVPASREFYWGGIRRAIEQPAQPIRSNVGEGWMAGLRRRFVFSTSALGTVAAVILATFFMFDGRNTATYSLPEEISNLNDDMNSISFRSETHQMTVVFLFDREAAEEVTAPAVDAADESADEVVQ